MVLVDTDIVVDCLRGTAGRSPEPHPPRKTAYGSRRCLVGRCRKKCDHGDQVLTTYSLRGQTREIRQILDIGPLDPQWCLPSTLAENPLVWMIAVNGVIVDVRSAPRELQEQAYQLGLIPFIPE